MTDYKTPSYDELVRIEREARKLQAQAFASGIHALARWARTLPAALGGLMARRAHS